MISKKIFASIILLMLVSCGKKSNNHWSSQDLPKINQIEDTKVEEKKSIYVYQKNYKYTGKELSLEEVENTFKDLDKKSLIKIFISDKADNYRLVELMRIMNKLEISQFNLYTFKEKDDKTNLNIYSNHKWAENDKNIFKGKVISYKMYYDFNGHKCSLNEIKSIASTQCVGIGGFPKIIVAQIEILKSYRGSYKEKEIIEYEWRPKFKSLNPPVINLSLDKKEWLWAELIDRKMTIMPISIKNELTEQ